MRGAFYCNMYKLWAKYTIGSINDPYCWKGTQTTRMRIVMKIEEFSHNMIQHQGFTFSSAGDFGKNSIPTYVGSPVQNEQYSVLVLEMFQGLIFDEFVGKYAYCHLTPHLISFVIFVSLKIRALHRFPFRKGVTMLGGRML